MYSAKELSEKLINDGFPDMSVRKINYYAFEKKMFPVTGSGKNVFSDEDYDKLKSIAFLRQNSNYSLDEIRDKIMTHSFQEVDQMVLSKTITEYTTRNSFVSNAMNNITTDTSSPVLDSVTTQATTCDSFDDFSSNSTSFSCSDKSSYSLGGSNTCSSLTPDYTNNYTGTSHDFLRSNGTSAVPYVNTPNLPSFATQISSSDLKEKKTIETNGKTRIKISKGIFIEYDKTANQKEVEKLIEISKIIFD